MRVAIYARYSSDKQAETSIADQVAICQARALREGWQVVFSHSDNAVSGSTAVGSRPGGAALLADALAGRFDVLLLEGLDRLSRDQVEQERIVRRLEHRDIRIVGLADGYDSQHAGRKVMRGVRGLINELYLDDLRHKTQRGMHGQVDRGYIAGGKCYGYRIMREEGGSRYEIDEAQAHWVRWIFEQAASGRAFRGIVYELNERAVPSPRDSSWTLSAIYGSPVKGSGLLNNCLYVGRYIWNRSQWLKDPDTGRRQRVDRPRSEWRETAVPELRIVPDELWLRVRDRIDEGRDEFGRKRSQRPPGTLLGGLMRCPYCGGPMIALNQLYYGCNVGHDRGPTVCRGFRIRRDLAERRLVTAVREDLLSSAAAEEFERAFLEQVAMLAGQDSAMTAMQRRVDELAAEVGRLVEAIAVVGVSSALAARLQAAEREQAGLMREIELMSKANADSPDIRGVFRRLLINLGDALRRDAVQGRAALAEIIERVDIELRGDEVWGHIATGPALQIAVGASCYNDGCGGWI
ncbi:Recombinase [Azotobacter vinelandii CA]|uniref:Recombinase n=2 Tax=Azotobacter vinelandii TaxID=354 RepID=C1DRY4_AZOVD|nr:recombinase family protein [Azotobacter vinelandii]ACO79859.1 Recombinase [Azotobacter vinelandii DJ]AGK16191.1 Recombinase [Azotobacter vinelandii CA]AGK21555.1 Recombinase [Azotobacter vinelandii CA6]GLK62332.1 resolvase [Azotobacter vinelandii]